MTLSDFKDRHPDQRAFIIGKGPSLDTVEEISAQLSTGIIFCLNESIHKIESLNLTAPTYVVQQDSNLESDCVPKNPSTVHFMNFWQHVAEDRHGKSIAKKSFMKVSPWNPNAVLYNPAIFNETVGSLSAIIALKIAQLMGVKKVTFCCFDAMAGGYQGSNFYADCVGKQREGSHRSHDAVIMIEAHNIMTSIKTLKPTVAILETKV